MTRVNSFGLVLTLTACSLLPSCSKQMPVLSLDSIPNGIVVKGVTPLSGWAAQNSGIRSVTLYVDAKRAVEATIHLNRPDVIKAYPQFRSGAISGWQARLDAASLPVGLHYLTVQARANDGTYTQQTIDMIVSR